MRTRYPGPKPFSDQEQDLFHGRDAEEAELLRLVQFEQVVVLYGKSGYGKSSLLNAAVLPAIRDKGNMNIVQVRFYAWTEGKAETPADIARDCLSSAHPVLSESSIGLLDRLIPQENSLWYAAKKQQLAARQSGLLLVFDQFEELFSYPDSAVQDFKAQFTELLVSAMPQRFRRRFEALRKENPKAFSAEETEALYEPLDARALFAIRSDRMHLLAKLTDYIPNLLRNTYELKALRREDAKAALLEPACAQGDFATPAFEFQPAAAAAVLDYLQDREGRVEAIQLQILAESFEEKAKQEKIRDFDLARIGSLEGIVDKYYRSKIATIADPADRLAARRLIEEGLVLEGERQRLSLHEGQIRALFAVQPELLRLLEDSRLLRAEPAQRGGYTYELPHDTLIDPVLKAKNERLLEDAKRRKEAEDAAREEALLAAQRRAEEERHLREAAERGEQRARQRTRLALLLTLLAIGAGLFAFYKQREATDALGLADKRRLESEASLDLAKKNEQTANTATAEAKQNLNLAKANEDKARKALAQADANLLLAKKEEARAKEAFEQVQKEKTATEEQRKLAVQNAQLAEEKTRQAEQQRQAAQAALQELEKQSALVVEGILRDANNDIYHLRYDAAFEKLAAAAGISQEEPEIAALLFEIAFFHEESGHPELARAPLDRGLQLIGLPAGGSMKDVLDFSAWQGLKKALYARYYPVMLDVQGGSFLMGCDSTRETCNPEELPRHEVRLRDFQLARTETTVWNYALYAAATDRKMLDISPTWGLDGDNPVVNITWYDAARYLNWLSKKSGLDTVYVFEGDVFKEIKPGARGYRLPSEAEWEYAAKGGPLRDDFIYSGTSDKIADFAWYTENSDTLGVRRTRPVGTRLPNSLGLRDMSGNVWEWCNDWYDEKYYEQFRNSAAENPLGPNEGNYRVLRGGSWNNDDFNSRSANRDGNSPVDWSIFFGCRAARHL